MITSKPMIGAAVIVVLASLPTRSTAQGSDTFHGKTVTIYVGNPVGGGYDKYGRLIACHMGRHLPGNPIVIVSNMPGAASITCANYLYNTAPHDGTALGVLAQNFEEEQVFGTAGVQFDAAKFSWIGRMAGNVEMLYVWHTVPVKTIADVKKRETPLAAAGPSAIIYPTLLNTMIGTRFKLVRGYRGTQDAHLAMERGEVDGVTSSINTIKATAPDWLTSGKITVLVQYALQRHPELPNIPAVIELAQNASDRAILAFFAKSALIGRAIIAPPDVAADRLAMVRAAFDATMKDPEFLADAKRGRFIIEPMGGAELQKLTAQGAYLQSAERKRARAARQNR